MRRRRVLRWVATLGLVVALGSGSWWWTHPSVLSDGAGLTGIDPLPVAQATSSMGLPGLQEDGVDETIVLTEVKIHFSTNSADATASLAVCRRRTSRGASPFGAGPAKDVHPYCRSLPRAGHGTRMHLGERGDYFILTIHPADAGKATVSSIDVSYRRGVAHLFQRGTQHISGPVFTIATT